MATGAFWLTPEQCNLDDFRSLVERETLAADYPNAARIEQNVPIYELGELGSVKPDERQRLQAELIDVLLDGPGIVVFSGAFLDGDVVDAASNTFRAMIEQQRAVGAIAGDHFAKPGANDRVWNALEKLALHDPPTFCAYYANDVIALIAQAWLGPHYQVTSQINVVNPGGASQEPHRDYHLGFQDDATAARYPAHVHRLSPALTLQGAIAHVDMPIETGPTVYLPYSQLYEPGYVAWRRQDFNQYFWDHHVQLPLRKGDAVFFNPALLHAAGHNHSTSVLRMANLLQISSAFGRAMESIDRSAITLAIMPELQRLFRAGTSEVELRNVLAAAAEGYAFPTNLDRDPPVDGLAPRSQAAIAWLAVQELWPLSRLTSKLVDLAGRQKS